MYNYSSDFIFRSYSYSVLLIYFSFLFYSRSLNIFRSRSYSRERKSIIHVLILVLVHLNITGTESNAFDKSISITPTYSPASTWESHVSVAFRRAISQLDLFLKPNCWSGMMLLLSQCQ